MDDYTSSLRRYWLEEEEDDDMDFLFDEDEAEAMTYNHLLQAESSRRRVDPMRHQRSFGRETFLLVTGGLKLTTSLQILFTMISSFVEGKLEHISDTDGSMYAVAHMRSGLAGFGCVGIYSNTSKRRSKIMITTSEKGVMPLARLDYRLFTSVSRLRAFSLTVCRQMPLTSTCVLVSPLREKLCSISVGLLFKFLASTISGHPTLSM